MASILVALLVLNLEVLRSLILPESRNVKPRRRVVSNPFDFPVMLLNPSCRSLVSSNNVESVSYSFPLSDKRFLLRFARNVIGHSCLPIPSASDL